MMTHLKRPNPIIKNLIECKIDFYNDLYNYVREEMKIHVGIGHFHNFIDIKIENTKDFKKFFIFYELYVMRQKQQNRRDLWQLMSPMFRYIRDRQPRNYQITLTTSLQAGNFMRKQYNKVMQNVFDKPTEKCVHDFDYSWHESDYFANLAYVKYFFLLL